MSACDDADPDTLISRLAGPLSPSRRSLVHWPRQNRNPGAQLAQPIPAAAPPAVVRHDALPRRQQISDANGHGVLRSHCECACLEGTGREK